MAVLASSDCNTARTRGGTNTKQRNLRHLFTWLEATYDHPHPCTDELSRFVAFYPQAQGGITSVSASSAANAWAIGTTGSGSSCWVCLVTSHWNGKKWQMIAEPNGLRGGVNDLVTYAAVAATAGAPCLDLRDESERRTRDQ